jgi:hypothetical protein
MGIQLQGADKRPLKAIATHRALRAVVSYVGSGAVI